MQDPTEGQRLYAIGDIHGQHQVLTDMMARILSDLERRPHPAARLIFLGDYVDRGPEIRATVETLMALRDGPLRTDFLLGNHDSYVEAYLSDPDWYDRTYHWLHPNMGGAVTLASYGVPDASVADPWATRSAFAAAIPASHRAFLRDCLLWLRVGGYVFVHAGLRPGVALEAQTRDDCIWIREPFLSSGFDFGFKVVHGHTIVAAVEHHPNRIAIDTGVAKGGPLTCLLLEGERVGLLEPNGPQPLPEGSGLGLDRLGRGLRRRLGGLLGR